MDSLWFTASGTLMQGITQWLHGLGVGLPADTAKVVGDAAARLDMPALLALAAVLGWASGVRLYAVVFLTGLSGLMGWVPLPAGLQVLQHPALLTASCFMLFVEFFADKVPGLDSLWDLLHSVVRVPAGAALAAAVFGADNTVMALVAGLLGGSLSATALATKMTTRAAVNTSPEPFSNGLVSLFEDGLVLLLMWLALHHPVVFAVAMVVTLAASVALMVVLFRFLRAVLRRVSRVFSGSPGVA